MALPKQVEQDIKDLEEFEKQLAAQQEPPKEEPKETEVKDEDPKPEETPKAEDEKPPEPTVTEVSDDFKQKYNTLRGKYDAEVPRLHAQVKELVAEVSTLKSALEKANETPEVPTEPVSLVTDEDREEFGDDLINVARKVAKEEFQPLVDAQAREIASLKEQLQNTGNQVTEVSFEQKLAAAVPDFAEINKNQAWLDWLNEFDPMLRGPRRNAAQAAFDAGDVDAVADYVRMFKDSLTPVETETKAEKRRKELESQVTPERNVDNTTVKTTEQKSYTKAQADQMWLDVQNLLSRGDYEKANKLEAQITQAYLEGRVEQ